jgi:hypothetical protein
VPIPSIARVTSRASCASRSSITPASLSITSQLPSGAGAAAPAGLDLIGTGGVTVVLFVTEGAAAVV